MFTQNLVIKYRYWIPKLLWQKLWLVNSVIVRDHHLPVGQESKNLMKHPCPEKYQLQLQERQMRCHYCNNEGSDHKNQAVCIYAWLKIETVSWSIICNFLLLLHCLLYTILKISYSCLDYLVFFYHKYDTLYVVEYAYVLKTQKRRHTFNCSHS